MSGNAFIIEEANITLRTGDENGLEYWIGGCANNLSLNKEFQERPIETPGQPYSEADHENESHVIEMENVWLMKTDGPDLPLMPFMQRGQAYALVIEWRDRETGYQNKRTYRGVTWRAQKVGSQAMQNVTFRAQSMAEYAGFETVYYVSGRIRTPIYRYNPGTETFTMVGEGDDVTGLGEIRRSSGKVEIFVEGVLALRADADGVAVDALRAIGTTTVPIPPRLEFLLDSRVATVTKEGELVAGNLYEDDALFAAAKGMIFKDSEGVRRMVFGNDGAYVPWIAETELV